MFTPSKFSRADAIDLTILNTPQPQATSTVQRKSTLESRVFDTDVNEGKYKSLGSSKSDAIQQPEDSSLGLLDNISTFLAEVSEMNEIDKQNENKVDTEREVARKLLQRCSNIKTSTALYEILVDTNKENNANIQNVAGNTSLILVDQSHSLRYNQNDTHNENTMQPTIQKTGSATVVFEPNEISARSSGLSRSSEKCLSTLSNKIANTISFDATTADFMAQFNNEEFRSGSEMASQLLADEASWQQNYSYALPITTPAEKEYLNFSCFSGIIGELDLSVESCAGRKMSVDEFFKRKCGNIGELSNDGIERPSLGISVSSPKKKGELVPLIDSTIMTEASSVTPAVTKDSNEEKNHPVVSNITKDIEEQSIMSLSTIAQALQDIDNGTPRRLVDQLIMAKKKKKLINQEANTTGATYTVMPSSRKSMPVTPSIGIDKFEKHMEILNLSTKLSLDSKLVNETMDIKQSVPRMLSFASNTSTKASEAFANTCEKPELKKEIKNGSLNSAYNQNTDVECLLDTSKLSLSFRNAAVNSLSHQYSNLNLAINEKQNLNDLPSQRTEHKKVIKEENISYKSKDSTAVGSSDLYIESHSNRDVVIGKSTDELCNCIVGIPRETDIELLNRSDRWVICSLSLNQIQGDKQHVLLSLPKHVILIKPSAVQCAKIGVKVVKMSKPIIAVINITISDMVTRVEWTMKHIICFKPEELNICISNMLEKTKLDFECIVENTISTLPVTIQNHNSIPVPIKLFIVQAEPIVFSIENIHDIKNLILKPGASFTVHVQCKAVLPGEQEMQRRTQRYDAKLMLQLDSNSNDLTIKEIPLVAQVGTFKIEIVDTEIPLIIPNKQTKALTIINLGSVPITISASFAQESEAKALKDFIVQPENLFLLCDETGSFLISYKSQTPNVSKRYAKIKICVGNNTYYYSVIGEQNTAFDPELEPVRCETPQYSISASSPTSPHSVTSNRSGTSGRNSPMISVAGSSVARKKLPIRATHLALVWNTVKSGKSEVKQCTIRNMSDKKIKIQAFIKNDDNSFRFLKDRQSTCTSFVLALHPSESRTLYVTFNPNHVGPASGRIFFKYFESRTDDNDLQSMKFICLYGYGGHAKIKISEVFKDISGKIWLSLGTLNSSGSLNAKMKLQNPGDLCLYAKMKLIPKAIYPMSSSWHVHPTELLLNPKESQWVTVDFRPKKDDLAHLQRADVSHVGTVTIIYGDEPTRWRIRRLYNKMKETGEFGGCNNEAFKNIVQSICKAFPDELMPDLSTIKDSTQNLGDLCRSVRQHEIMLTMEVPADETLSILHDNVDDSQLFYSLRSDNSHVYDGSGKSFLPSVTLDGQDVLYDDMEDEDFTVHPNTVELRPPQRLETAVIIRSSCKVAQAFDTCLTNTEYLRVVPAEGMIPTRKGFELKIICSKRVDHSFDATLEIFTENNKQDVLIKVIFEHI